MDETVDFSLVIGGPLYQLWRKTRLVRPPLTLLPRRMFVISMLAWLPLVPLALLSGHFWGGVNIPFIYDVGVHTRFLLVLPMLIAAEPFVHTRLRMIVGQFLDRDLIAPAERSRFDEIIDSSLRLRNSIPVEVGMLLFVFIVGHWVWQRYSPHVATWYETEAGGKMGLNWAGYWFVYVSIPIFQFILLRWYYRLILWYRFLWRVSRLNLRLVGIHPDQAGGIGFVGISPFAFSPIFMAHSVLLASLIGNYIWHEGANLLAFKMEITGCVVILLLVALAPLMFFSVQLRHARWKDLRKFGAFAVRYTREFDEKWFQGALGGKDSLGSGDIQSLADLANSYQVVNGMRTVPITKDELFQLALLFVVPFVPLTLTMIPLEKLIGKFFGIIL